jgi:cell fate regulator YaaT (PSP1 superfamily)
MQKIVGIKRDGDKNLYYFLKNIDVKLGDKVVAVFDEFQTVAEVAKICQSVDDDKASELPKLSRKATESDMAKYNELKKKAKSELPEIKKKSVELGLVMKFVGAEYSLDNSKIIITFSSEERVDFRQFLKELASMLKTRIELKQIGQRDEIKICGGVGPCGQPCCCSRFLNDFDHVTVKMAKVQGLSLSPTKINGICGRLMCCLGYEAGAYEETLAKMPKINSEVTSPKGKGIAVYNDILRERVSIKRQAEGDTFVVEDYALDEVFWDGKKETEKTKQKSENNKENDKESKDNNKENKDNTKNNIKDNTKENVKDNKNDKINKNGNIKNDFDRKKNFYEQSKSQKQKPEQIEKPSNETFVEATANSENKAENGGQNGNIASDKKNSYNNKKRWKNRNNKKQ